MTLLREAGSTTGVGAAGGGSGAGASVGGGEASQAGVVAAGRTRRGKSARAANAAAVKRSSRARPKPKSACNAKGTSKRKKRASSAHTRGLKRDRRTRSKGPIIRRSSITKKPRRGTPRRIRYRCDTTTTILDVLRDRGWTQVGDNDESWHLNWCDVVSVRPTLDRRLQNNQHVPHFRNHYELTRKNLLARNLKRLKRSYQRNGMFEDAVVCDCMPVTFELPMEYLMFVEEYRKNPGATWIVKPVTGCQGRGIFLFQRLKDLVEWRARREASAANSSGDGSTPESTMAATDDENSPGGVASSGNGNGGASGAGSGTGGGSNSVAEHTYVVQRYIENPYLVAGRKFDVRIYVLVTSFHPLKAWLAREGFARLSMEQFSLSLIRDNRVHLTNMAVQMRASRDAIQRGCKWSMRRLREFLTARHGAPAIDALLQQLTHVVVTSLKSVKNVITHDKHCFELYGYDILLDENLKPWLLEVNASPSLAATDPEDYRLKYSLLMDTLNVLDLERRLTGLERRVGGFDLIWDNGPVAAGNPGAGREACCDAPVPLTNITSDGFTRLNVFLGCSNEREKQLEVVWKDAAKQRAAKRRSVRNLSPLSESLTTTTPSQSAPTCRSGGPPVPPAAVATAFVPIPASLAVV